MEELLKSLFRRMKRDVRKGNSNITGITRSSSYLVGVIEFTSYENMMVMKALYEYYLNIRNREPLIYWNDRLYRNGIPLLYYSLEIYSKGKYSKKKCFYRDLNGMKILAKFLRKQWQLSKRIPEYYAYMRRDMVRNPKSLSLENTFWEHLLSSVVVHEPGQIIIDKSEDQDGIVCIVILIDESLSVSFELSMNLEINLVIERDE